MINNGIITSNGRPAASANWSRAACATDGQQHIICEHEKKRLSTATN